MYYAQKHQKSREDITDRCPVSVFKMKTIEFIVRVGKVTQNITINPINYTVNVVTFC